MVKSSSSPGPSGKRGGSDLHYLLFGCPGGTGGGKRHPASAKGGAGGFAEGWALGQVFRFHREIPMDGFLKFPAVYFCLFHRISYLCQKYTSIVCS